MNHSMEDSPLLPLPGTQEKMERWVAAQKRGEKIDLDVYGKPSAKQLQELENVRNLSKELQDNLHELENNVRDPEADNQEMCPTAEILDYSDEHEFMSANQADDYYSTEDTAEAKEEEKRKLTKGKGQKSEIQKFYKDQCIFLTGGTGFLGKVLIEKLLRTCGDLDTIYVLVRGKKGKDPRTRMHELLDDFLFEKAHQANPKGIHKIVPIVGDMELPGLGINEEERKTLIRRVTVIINAAATVKFDEKLSISTAINVKGTKEVMKLAKECKNLKALTHVSTAFSNTHVDFIDEKFYEPPMSVETLEAVSELDEAVIESILPNILGNRPNTYCLTKAVAEEAVRKYGEGMPICIVRPSIVISTYEEPVRSWTDSVYGPTGIIIGIGTGVLRTMYLAREKVADMVPVDLCVSAMLAATWRTATAFRENQTSDIPIYNFVSGAQKPITWGEFIDVNRKYGIEVPTTKAVWYYGLTATNNYYMFLFLNFFLHYLPAMLADVYCLLAGKKRFTLKVYNKVMKLANILFYFSTQDWKFSDQNVQLMWSSLSDADKVLFPFNMGDFNWETMSETFLLGLRVYFLKDDLSTLPEARKKWFKLFLAHQVLRLLTVIFVLYLGYFFISSLISLVL